MDEKRFYENNIKSYSHENLYLFKKDLLNKIKTTSIELLIKLGPDESNDPRNGNSVDLLINKFKELTVNDDRKLTEAAITLYNDLL